MQYIRPRRLRPGDIIGVISPASPIAGLCPRRMERGIGELKRMGFQVVVGKYARQITGHTAGTIQQRLDDLHDMFSRSEVSAIFTTIGGFNSHQLLDELDFDLIAANPKILMGYSDITALLTAVHKETNLVTFMGPAVLPQFAEYEGMLAYTKARMEAVLMMPAAPGVIPVSEAWTDELLYWDEQDNRARQTKRNAGMRIVRPGQAQGAILAANAGTLLLLAGTRWFPDMKGRILCLEDDESETPGTIDRYLTQLRHLGVFSEIAGLVVGRFHSRVPFKEDDTLEQLLLTAARGTDFPIVVDADFGHTDPMMTLPNGVQATLTARDQQLTFELNEPAVE